MSLARHSLVGTIRVASPARRAGAAAAFSAATDDSTLGQLLESLAFQEALSGHGEGTGCLLVATRVSRFRALTEWPLAVRADLPQLARDLRADYAGLQRQAAGERR